MTDRSQVRFESRMLIDGVLVDGGAGRFTNLNPATEEKSIAYPAVGGA